MKNNLKVERAIKDIIQVNLVEIINISRQMVNTMEKGKRVLSMLLALKIAKYFEKPLEDND